jgi:hypothetical protein
MLTIYRPNQRVRVCIITIEDLATALKVDFEKGINSSETAERLSHFGPAYVSDMPKEKPFSSSLYEALTTFLTIVFFAYSIVLIVYS